MSPALQHGLGHLALHVLVPLLLARRIWRARWQEAFLVMVATMVVDLDHLFADPVYDPKRCSITTHPLHSPVLIAIYAGVFFGALLAKRQLGRWRAPMLWVGTGLLVHMGLDLADCILL